MRWKPVRFLDRGDAGRRLAETVAREGLPHPVVFQVGEDLSEEG